MTSNNTSTTPQFISLPYSKLPTPLYTLLVQHVVNEPFTDPLVGLLHFNIPPSAQLWLSQSNIFLYKTMNTTDRK